MCGADKGGVGEVISGNRSCFSVIASVIEGVAECLLQLGSFPVQARLVF
jgi:hypothetical protein